MNFYIKSDFILTRQSDGNADNIPIIAYNTIKENLPSLDRYGAWSINADGDKLTVNALYASNNYEEGNIIKTINVADKGAVKQLLEWSWVIADKIYAEEISKEGIS